MSITDRLFRRGPRRGEPPPVALDLALLRNWFAGNAARYEGKVIEPDLVRAQLADRCRDVGAEPLLPQELALRTEGLDEEGWRRLALALSALDVPEVRDLLTPGRTTRSLSKQVEALVGLAREMSLLTLELLRQSGLRVEEFARQFLARLGVGVEGEAPAQSRQRLERLDYARLLAEAERAKLSAEDRMEYLRQLQEEQEARRTRRGTW